MPKLDPATESQKKPALIDLVLDVLKKEWSWLGKGTVVPDWWLFVYEASTRRYEISISGRCVGILIDDKWYGWLDSTDLSRTLIPIRAADPKFFDKILQDSRESFIRSGEDVRWKGPKPT